MRALWMEQGQITLRDLPVPDSPDDCLIRVGYAGICGTDLHMRRGYAEYTGVAGHEFVGVVEHAPASAAGWLGRRVVGDINIGCGRCRSCLAGVKEHCEARAVLGLAAWPGTFAEYITLPVSCLHAVPDGVDDRAAVFTEPIAAACRILDQVSVGAGQSVAVLGDGRMGLLTAQVLATTGAAVVVLGRHETRLELARRLGLDARCSPSGPLAPADRFDLVVELTGRTDGLEHALDLVRPLGTIVFKTTAPGAPSLATWPIVVHEITIVGSRCGPFEPALSLLADGRVATEPLVEGVFPLAEHERAFAAAEHGLKVLFTCA